MNKNNKLTKRSAEFRLYAADAVLWEENGLLPADEEALVLALWRWYRGRPDPDALSVPARLVYAPLVARWDYTNSLARKRSQAGANGAAARWRQDATVPSVLSVVQHEGHGKADGQTNGKANGKSDDASDGKTCPTQHNATTATASATTTASESVDAPTRSTGNRFARPSVEEVRAYCQSRGYADVDAERFVDYYEAKGWVVGHSPMKDWQAAVRNWHGRSADAERARASAAPAGASIRDASRKENDYVL